jgi:hypothetical protein
MDFLGWSPRFGHDLDMFANSKSYAFQDCTSKRTTIVAQRKAAEAATQGRVKTLAIGYIG